jgi:hypothetical protein
VSKTMKLPNEDEDEDDDDDDDNAPPKRVKLQLWDTALISPIESNSTMYIIHKYINGERKS